MSSRQPIFYSAVFVLLQNENGEVLLQKRQNTGYMDGRYDTSMSGHVEAGESVYDAAVRETAEEIGVSIQSEGLELIMLSQMDADRPYLNYTFVCKKWEGEPKIMEPEKNGELSWLSLKDLPDELTPTLALIRERGVNANISKIQYVDTERLRNLIDL